MRRVTVVLSTVILGVGMAGVPSTASAATGEFGNACVATTASSGATAVMTGGSGANPLPIAAPATGVITKAKIALPPTGPIPVVLKVLRPTGALNAYTVLAESASIVASGGTNTFDVRVPVTAGDLLGMGGTAALMCNTGNAADTVATIAGNSPVGSSLTYTPSTSVALSMVATVEPDADHDGFGDVTQDKCPQSAAFQTACPVVTLDSFAATQGGTVTVLVSTDNQADVKVAGKAKVNGKNVKLKGGTQTIKAGALARFKVSLPAKLRQALAGLPANKSIKVSFTATSTDLVGRKSSDKCSVRLPGTGH